MKPTDGSLDQTLTPEDANLSSDTLQATAADGMIVPVATEPSIGTKYRLGELLGRGGMGEVVLAEEVEMGRSVAVKRMRSASPSPESVARFLREAKIQGRLDHPAIVPVHELGRDAEGRPFFTMKRLSGTTLAEVVAVNRRNTSARLLRAFVEVCQAIEFAHARGVIHRDLKPANIMLGEYGEVYVLDWGVARVVSEQDQTRSLPGFDTLEGETQEGAVLGTPGYMSPEQVRGEAITTATDVYALGAILFEILAGQPAHPGGHQGMISTLAGEVDPPGKRVPDRAIAPELDKVCVAALAFEAADRPTAAQLASNIERYLDGDRDLARRRTLAAEHLVAAREALASGDPARRAEAVQCAGRALGLDPESEAAALIGQLMIEPPEKLPAELSARLERMNDSIISRQSRVAARSLASYFAMFPVMVWMGIRDWQLVGAMFALVIFNISIALKLMKLPHALVILTFSNALLIVIAGRTFGPFIYVPMLFVGVAVAMIANPALVRRPVLVIGTMIAGYLAPIALEGLGVWTRTWDVIGGRFTVDSPVVYLEREGVLLFLTIAGCILLVVMPLFVRSLALAQQAARRRVEVQVWHLGQLLPKKTGPA